MSDDTTTRPRFKKSSDSATAVASMEAFFERAALAQAPAWRPVPGDVLSGTILGFRKGSTTEYGEYPVLVVDGGDGKPVAFHAFHGVVRERLRELKPKKGDLLTVQYSGQKERTPEEIDAGKKEYHMYYIESGSADATPVLDEIEF